MVNRTSNNEACFNNNIFLDIYVLNNGNKQCEYINIKENIIAEAHHIVASLIYHTSSISEIQNIIMDPSLAIISDIPKDSFNFKNRTKSGSNGTTNSTCDIKSLYTNI